MILGTPFLRKHKIVLDFSSPGSINMGNKLIPTNKTAFNDKALKEDCNPKVVQITSGLWQTMAHWCQEGEPHKGSHPHLPCGGREEHPHHQMRVVKNREKILQNMKPCWQDVKLSRSLSDCWDPVRSKINLLPLLRLRSDHPLRLWHYTNQTPKLQAPPKPSDALLLLSENSKWPWRTPITFLSSFVFIIPF